MLLTAESSLQCQPQYSSKRMFFFLKNIQVEKTCSPRLKTEYKTCNISVWHWSCWRQKQRDASKMDPMCTRTSDARENNDRGLVGKASVRTMGQPQRELLKVHPFMQYSLQKHSDSTCKRQNCNYSNIKTSVPSKIHHKWGRGSTEWEALLKTGHLSETAILDVKGLVPVSN